MRPRILREGEDVAAGNQPTVATPSLRLPDVNRRSGEPTNTVSGAHGRVERCVVGYFFLGANLHELRTARRLTQHALAQLAGPPFSQAYISRLERGLMPSDPGHIDILAALLKVSPRRLLQPPRPARAFRPRRHAAPDHVSAASTEAVCR